MALPMTITCEQAAERLKAPSPPALLDVRNPDEHAFAALPGSLLIPLHELEDRADELLPFKGREVIVYCHHGVRSLSGAGWLRAKGYDATSMAGGIDAWSLTIDRSVRRY